MGTYIYNTTRRENTQDFENNKNYRNLEEEFRIKFFFTKILYFFRFEKQLNQF